MYENWVSRDYGREGKAVNFSKARIGEFVYAVIAHGGRVTSTYCMNTKYPRAYCQFSIELPNGERDKFVEETGFALETPPQLVLA